MNAQTQDIKEISHHELVQNCLKLKSQNVRLVQICATRTEGGFELSYSFADGYRMLTLRAHITEEDELSSISTVFPPAFLYENEMKDLFGIKIRLITVDYGGNLYRIEKKAPFRDREGGGENV
jgi:ech hydrogenase subunit D